jgi:predicted RNA binding protein YcfA (HicA-like mRNA interferase family)
VKSLKFKEIILVLKENGFQETNVRGSHARYVGMVDGQKQLVTVQINHLSDTADPGTFKSIIRQSGLPASKFSK